MDCTTKMESNKSSAIVAFILGVCLLQSGRASTSINLATYNGKVGHATSYNYPFKHTSYNFGTYTYRLFADTASPQKMCLTFRRFEMTSSSKFTVSVKTSGGTTQKYEYTGNGESVDRPSNSPLPDNIWNQTFCVDLAGDTFLQFTFYPEPYIPLSGFYLEYQATGDLSQPVYDEFIPQTNDSIAPCGSGLFTCYNRECVNDRYVCTSEAACTDMSHNTFAHAFCKDDYPSYPIQQSGFWATDLDNAYHGISVDYGWTLARGVDHTGGGQFLYTKFSSTRYDLTMTFNPGRVVQKENCLSFWYYMDGRDPGALVVKWLNFNKVWERSGSYGAKWLQAQVNLFCESPPCSDKVKITASRGSNPDTRISVDDISVMPGLCPFYEAAIIRGAWTTDGGCTFITEVLECGSLTASSAHTKSWLVSRGRCLVGEVWFDALKNPAQTVMVFKYPAVDGSEVHLKTLQQSTTHQKLPFKIPIELSVPAKIGFRTIFNKGRIWLINTYVVDNECDNLSIGVCSRYMFYCAEAECISEYRNCDGVKDCSNGKDEEECTECGYKAFLCRNSRCVESHLVCNGVNDCQDNSDEQECGAEGGPAGSPAGPPTSSIIGIVIGVLVAVSVSFATVAVFLHKGYCQRKKPQEPLPLDTLPTYSECVADTNPHLGQVSNPPQPPPYTSQVPPPYNEQPPPAYGEVSNYI